MEEMQYVFTFIPKYLHLFFLLFFFKGQTATR